MSSVSKTHYTAEEYLKRERAAEVKSEYINGSIFAMAGASNEHNVITANIARLLGNQLLNRPCQTTSSDLRVKVSETGLYTYPDVVVVCGKPEFEDEAADTLLNPTVIFEVLSPSTEAYDRGAKFHHYWRLRSLREYLLVAQDTPRVEHFVRQRDNEWLISISSDCEELITLPSIECSVHLAEIYHKIAFNKEV
jgi:Uma2 family endonuclease